MKFVIVLIVALLASPVVAVELRPEYDAPDLKGDFEITRKSYSHAGVDFVSHRILQHNSNWQVSLLTEKRNLPSDRLTQTQLKAFVNETVASLRKQGFTDLEADVTNIKEFDATAEIVVPLRMKRAQQTFLGEIRVRFTNLGHRYLMLAKDADQLREAQRVCAAISPVQDNSWVDAANMQVANGKVHRPKGGRFAIKIPTEFKVTEESTTDKDGRKWLTVQSPDVTFRLYSVDELKSAASLYEEALAADKANGFPRNSLGNFKLERAGRVYYRFDEINDGKFSSTYAADASKGVFGVLVEFKGVLAYCNNIPLLDAIVGSLVLQDAD